MKLETGSNQTIEAGLGAKAATAQIVRFDMNRPIDNVLRPGNVWWIDLCLSPRPQDVRACYPKHWGADRFEPIGDVFALPPGDVIRVKSVSGRKFKGAPQKSLVCQIDASILRRKYGIELELENWRPELGLDIADRNIRHLLLRLSREVARPEGFSDLMVDLIAVQLAIEVSRYCTATTREGGLDASQLRTIDDYVRSVRRPPELSKLAELCGLSVRQLSRRFQASRGHSIGRYIKDCRIETAKQLLLERKSIKFVAHALGFSSPSSFSYAFRTLTGVTPLAYRRLAS